ncbi:MAG: glycoside hydrolase family 127 protein, partial [Prevotella sp.]|nr:glycoside hydrolase family 127 protein [Prevotella sp.]
MKRLISAVLLSAAVAMPTMAQKQKTLGNGYPFTQVPFTSVKISQNTFWGARLKAAREVTVPLAFSKCKSEHRYKNFEMAAYTLQHPNHPGLDTKEWD